MLDIQTAAGVLITFLLDGGVNAAKVLIKGSVVNGAQATSKVWEEVLEERAEIYPLADGLAKCPGDADAKQALQMMLEEVLGGRLDLLDRIVQRNVNTGDIKADNGGAAIGVMEKSSVTIKNR